MPNVKYEGPFVNSVPLMLIEEKKKPISHIILIRTSFLFRTFVALNQVKKRL